MVEIPAEADGAGAIESSAGPDEWTIEDARADDSRDEMTTSEEDIADADVVDDDDDDQVAASDSMNGIDGRDGAVSSAQRMTAAGAGVSLPAPAPAAEPATATGTIPATRRAAFHAESAASTSPAPSAQAVERTYAPQDVALTSKRLGEFEAGRETADLLTADRLLDPHHVVRSEPEGAWQHFVYSISGHRINLGDGKRARARKALDRRIAAPLDGGARFVPVLSRKGGVGKTTVTTLLGMALAGARDDRVIAVDANPDRGTLADRIARSERQDRARPRARPCRRRRVQRPLLHRRPRRDATRRRRIGLRSSRLRGVQRP